MYEIKIKFYIFLGTANSHTSGHKQGDGPLVEEFEGEVVDGHLANA